MFWTGPESGKAKALLNVVHPPSLPQVQLSLAASKLENKDTWGKSDPFVRISKARSNGEWFPVLKSEASFGCPLWLLSVLCLLVMSRWSRQSYCPQPARLVPLRGIHFTPGCVPATGGGQQPEPHLEAAEGQHGFPVQL